MRAGHVPGRDALLQHPRGGAVLRSDPPPERVAFTEALRQTVRDNLEEMHQLYQKGYTPKGRPTKACNACSLKELCLPKLMCTRPVRDYLAAAMEETP